mmetsp:Transcript_74813/g.242920  ORF Transcript_74813/g.242920 Transcript_74813/m.242920 type:complete len:224 (+) Transcript_74813:2391-3062(+)
MWHGGSCGRCRQMSLRGDASQLHTTQPSHGQLPHRWHHGRRPGPRFDEAEEKKGDKAGGGATETGIGLLPEGPHPIHPHPLQRERHLVLGLSDRRAGRHTVQRRLVLGPHGGAFRLPFLSSVDTTADTKWSVWKHGLAVQIIVGLSPGWLAAVLECWRALAGSVVAHVRGRLQPWGHPPADDGRGAAAARRGVFGLEPPASRLPQGLPRRPGRNQKFRSTRTR